jgi:hypothetical protein
MKQNSGKTRLQIGLSLEAHRSPAPEALSPT